MFGLIKLILMLILLTGLAVYGGDIFKSAKERIIEVVNPELRKASLFESFQDEYAKVEEIIKQVRDNLDNPNFDKKAALEKGTKIIEGSKQKLNEIADSDETLIEKTFEGLNDLRQGVTNFFSDSSKKESQECKCSQ